MTTGSWQDIAASFHPWQGVIDSVRPDRKHSFVYYKNQFIAEIESKFRKMPRRFRYPVAKRYQSIFKKKGSAAALQKLNDSVNRLPKTGYSLAASDKEIVSFAETKSKELGRLAASLHEHGPNVVYRVLESKLKAIGLNAPEHNYKDKPLSGAIARMTDPLWLRSQLRKTQGRAIEQAARDFGLVSVKTGIYSSDESVYRRRGQKRRNRLMMEECLAVNELGDEYTLQALSDLSVSNPSIRRGELMTRIRGFEEVAADRGDLCEFITITCPSRFHAYRKAGGRNPKFNPELTPRDAQKYLSNIWAKVRAKLARLEIRLYGFRVAEPNHCGCPHWHMMVFVPESEQATVRQVIEHYALEDNPQEVIKNKSVRVKFVTIDPAKGTASGYIAKYISKNIDGHAIDHDLYGRDIEDAVERIDAWAACWGIRQFQQIGGPPVSVWRELRRMDSEESGILEQARAAADVGNWFDFVNAMGGPVVARDALPVRVAYIQSLDKETGELPLNKYGELSQGKIIGLWAGDPLPIVTRFHEWEIKEGGTGKLFKAIEGIRVKGFSLTKPSGRGGRAAWNDGCCSFGYRGRGYRKEIESSNSRQGKNGCLVDKGDAVDSIAFDWERMNGRAFPAAWTCVNNCTEVFNDGGRNGKYRKAEKPNRTGQSRANVPEGGFS